MSKTQQISSYQLFCLVVFFLVGSTTILQSLTASGRDTWISTILGVGAGGLMVFMITFLANRFPGKSLVEYSQDLFGKIPGKILGVLYLWYFLHLGTLVLRNYGDFLSTVVFPETPTWLFDLTMGLVVAFLVYKEVEVTGRVAEILFPFSLALVTFSSFLITFSGSVEIQNLKPFLDNGLKKFLLGTVPIAAFPFQELIVFAMILPYLHNIKNGRKILLAGLGLSGTLLTLIMIQTIAALGTYAHTLIFPRFFVVRLTTVGQFIQRIEPIVISAWLMGGLVKIGVCLHAFTAGTAQLLGIKDYKILVVPSAFILIAITDSLFKDVAEMLNFAVNIYPIYAFPFQVIFPVLMIIMALVRGKPKKQASSGQAASPNQKGRS